METDLNDVFVHNLHQIYFVEKFLVKALEKLAKNAEEKEIKETLEEHKKQTQDHVRNVESIFGLADLNPSEMESAVWGAMNKELDSLLKMVAPESKDFFILEAAAKAERLEISHYEALILASKDLPLENKSKILDLLRDNLSDEEKALKLANAGMKKQVTFWKRNIH